MLNYWIIWVQTEPPTDLPAYSHTYWLNQFGVDPAYCPKTARIDSSSPTTLVIRIGSDNGWMDGLTGVLTYRPISRHITLLKYLTNNLLTYIQYLPTYLPSDLTTYWWTDTKTHLWHPALGLRLKDCNKEKPASVFTFFQRKQQNRQARSSRRLVGVGVYLCVCVGVWRVMGVRQWLRRSCRQAN